MNSLVYLLNDDNKQSNDKNTINSNKIKMSNLAKLNTDHTIEKIMKVKKKNIDNSTNNLKYIEFYSN